MSKVSDFMEQVNKKVVIYNKRLWGLKKYYLSMYRVSMMALYDLSYIDDPTRYSFKKLNILLQEMGVKGMFSSIGKMVISTEQIEYAYYRNKGNDEVRELLSLLYKAIYYREQSKGIDLLYDSNHFSEKNKASVSLMIGLKGSKLYSRAAHGVCKSVLNCFLEEDETCEEYNFNEELWVLAMKELAIPEEHWFEDGLFDKYLTHEEEINCIRLLLEGQIPLTGKYAVVLKDWLRGHLWLSDGMSNMKKGLYEYLFASKYEEVFNIINDILEDKEIIAIDGSRYYKKRKIKNYTIPMGCFVVLSGDEEEVLDEKVNINGYTGEVYSRSYLDDECINYIGCPFELYISPKEKILVYDIEQVDTLANTWFSTLGVQWEFYTEEEVNNIPNKKYTLSDEEISLYNIYRDSLKGNLVGKMPIPCSQQLICKMLKSI